MNQKYSVNQHLVSTLLSFVKAGEIAIPEIQRPFVWDSTKVRNLMDSLYQGYPVGYLIAWQNPNTRLKDGGLSAGKKVLIDGQQRVTALMTAVLGMKVINKEYRQVRVQIAFHPMDERFEVFNPAIAKDKQWLPDIGPFIRGDGNLFVMVKEYLAANPDADSGQVENAFMRLGNLGNRQLGMIELAADLDIETVTEIFIRINSAGVVLSQADFAMSKMAANEQYGGHTLRKAIDYFCHMAIAPEFYSLLKDADPDFCNTDYFSKMDWLKNENDDLYDPSYSDMLRVAFTSEFGRGKFADLVSLLSGRDFETRTFVEEIAEASFAKLKNGVERFMNKSNFQRYVMILRSAGLIDKSLIRSQSVRNVGYILYLSLKKQSVDPALIETYVRRWVVMSILTGRYGGSVETQLDYDFKRINGGDFGSFLEETERATLSEAFWEAGILQSLETSVSTSPLLNLFWAAQVKTKDQGFLSRDITVDAMIEHHGDIHHLFPRAYLKAAGMTRGKYNQIANFAFTQTEINIAIGKKPPVEYMTAVEAQCAGGTLKYGGISDTAVLAKNLSDNCIPKGFLTMTADDYPDFLKARRELMAQKLQVYYESL